MATPIWNDKQQEWQLRIYQDGKCKKFTSNKPGIAGKKIVLKRAREFAEKGTVSSPTVQKEWDKYLEDVKARSSNVNYISVEKIGRLYILPKCSPTKLERLSLVDFQNIINSSKNAKGEPLSKKTYSNIRGTIINFLKFAYRDRVIDYMPDGLYIPKNAESVGKEILQPEQIKKLFSSDLNSNWYIEYFRLLLLSGARPGEILGLQWSDIEWDICTINRSINSTREITPGKNKNARRKFFLPPTAQEVIKRQKEKTQDLNSEWVFPSRCGDMSTQSMVYKQWIPLKEYLQTSACIYSFRHTFVSLMKSSTVSENLLKDIIGHSASMDTFGVYGHEVNGDKELIVEAIEQKITKII